MKKSELINWIYSKQDNLDSRGQSSFGRYTKAELNIKSKQDLMFLYSNLQGELYDTGIRSEARLHRHFGYGGL